ncbi:MAG: hypothetical protein QOG10_3442 [Kribbellaceae bacterium]|jgi:hypothetical protein|nr:hypothetical protein [Kribbellaceae bacterium]
MPTTAEELALLDCSFRAQLAELFDQTAGATA